MKNAIVFGIAIILSSIFIGYSYSHRNQKDGHIYVTGLGEASFTSDLIVWDCQFIAENKNLKQAYETIEKEKAIISEYLIAKGIKAENIVFNSVQTFERTKNQYAPNGDYKGVTFSHYQLRQTVTIESTEVDKIEKVSREITELLNKSVKLDSEAPRYYYTKLADLKLDLISKATEDAKLRADNIAKYSGGSLGKLVDAKMGVFQILGQNSNESYSWGGTFNTSAKNKTASITMKLRYKVK